MQAYMKQVFRYTITAKNEKGNADTKTKAFPSELTLQKPLESGQEFYIALGDGKLAHVKVETLIPTIKTIEFINSGGTCLDGHAELTLIKLHADKSIVAPAKKST